MLLPDQKYIDGILSNTFENVTKFVIFCLFFVVSFLNLTRNNLKTSNINKNSLVRLKIVVQDITYIQLLEYKM